MDAIAQASRATRYCPAGSVRSTAGLWRKVLQPLPGPLRPERHRPEPAIYHKADLGPQPYHRGLFPTATSFTRFCRIDPPRRVLTGRPYLFRFAPRATFRPSAPRTRATTLSTIGVPPCRQLSCRGWLPRCRWGELYAPDAAPSIPASTRRRSGDRRSRHACAREAVTGQSQGSHRARRPPGGRDPRQLVDSFPFAFDSF